MNSASTCLSVPLALLLTVICTATNASSESAHKNIDSNQSAGKEVAGNKKIANNQDTALAVCGEAAIKAWRFIHVGQASLLSRTCEDLDERQLTAPLVLHFDYQRSIPASAFRRAGATLIERNIDQQALDAIADRLQRFNQGYRDIAPGDRYTLRYTLEGQLQMWLNGELLAQEYGNDLARAYLSIWFGEHPYSARMKQALLGQRQ